MFERACSRGVELIKGKLTGIVFGENDKKPKVKGTLLNIIKEPFYVKELNIILLIDYFSFYQRCQSRWQPYQCRCGCFSYGSLDIASQTILSQM